MVKQTIEKGIHTLDEFDLKINYILDMLSKPAKEKLNPNYQKINFELQVDLKLTKEKDEIQ